MTKRIVRVLMATAGMIVLVGGGVAPAKADQSRRPTTIRGGYVNDLDCIPTGVGTTADSTVYNADCTGSSLWNGDLTGREVIKLHATVATSGRMSGTYEGVFVGTYLGDHSHGGLHTKGYFEVDENSQFLARSTITGLCGWAGSRGSMTYDGFSLNGGYVGTWHRPAVPQQAAPTCNPLEGLV